MRSKKTFYSRFISTLLFSLCLFPCLSSNAFASDAFSIFEGQYTLESGTSNCIGRQWFGRFTNLVDDHYEGEDAYLFSLEEKFAFEIFESDIYGTEFKDQLHAAAPKAKVAIDGNRITAELRGTHFCVLAGVLTYPCGLANIQAEYEKVDDTLRVRFSGFYSEGVKAKWYRNESCTYKNVKQGTEAP